MDILEISNDIEKKNITRYILEALPDWFGIPESREEYIEDSAAKIFFCAYSLHRKMVPLHCDSEKPRNNSKVMINIIKLKFRK